MLHESQQYDPKLPDKRPPKDQNIKGKAFVTSRLITNETADKLKKGSKVFFSKSGVKVCGVVDSIDDSSVISGNWWVDGMEDDITKTFMGIRYNGPVDIYYEDTVWNAKQSKEAKHAAIIKEAKLIQEAGIIDWIGKTYDKVIAGAKDVFTGSEEFSIKNTLSRAFIAFLLPGGLALAPGVVVHDTIKAILNKLTRQKNEQGSLTESDIEETVNKEVQTVKASSAYNAVEAKKKKKKKRKKNKKDEKDPFGRSMPYGSTFNTDLAFFTEVGVSPFGLAVADSGISANVNDIYDLVYSDKSRNAILAALSCDNTPSHLLSEIKEIFNDDPIIRSSVNDRLIKTADNDISLYYGTTSKFYPIIKNYGLKPESLIEVDDWTRPYDHGSCLYLPESPVIASLYARQAVENWGGKPLILKVKIADQSCMHSNDDNMSWQEYAQANGAAVHKGPISPDNLRVFRIGNKEHNQARMQDKLDKQFSKAREIKDDAPEIKLLSEVPYCVLYAKTMSGSIPASQRVLDIMQFSDDAQEFIHYYMSGRKAIKNAAKTLYHGTTADNYESIKDFGLIPDVGELVREAYEPMYEGYDVELPELTFMSDKEGIHRALTAIVSAIGRKLDKSGHDVTYDDLYKYGLLAILRGEPGEPAAPLKQRPEFDDDWESEGRETVEPGDYFSEYGVKVDDLLMRDTMMKVFKRLGVIPVRYRPEDTVWGS